MNDIKNLFDGIKDKMLDSVPNIWESLKKSAARKIAEQLIYELNHVPSNCGKLIYEQVNEIPAVRRVA